MKNFFKLKSLLSFNGLVKNGRFRICGLTISINNQSLEKLKIKTSKFLFLTRLLKQKQIHVDLKFLLKIIWILKIRKFLKV